MLPSGAGIAGLNAPPSFGRLPDFMQKGVPEAPKNNKIKINLVFLCQSFLVILFMLQTNRKKHSNQENANWNLSMKLGGG